MNCRGSHYNKWRNRYILLHIPSRAHLPLNVLGLFSNTINYLLFESALFYNIPTCCDRVVRGIFNLHFLTQKHFTDVCSTLIPHSKCVHSKLSGQLELRCFSSLFHVVCVIHIILPPTSTSRTFNPSGITLLIPRYTNTTCLYATDTYYLFVRKTEGGH